MKSGFKIRSISLTFSAMISAIFQNLFVNYIETAFVGLQTYNKNFSSIISIIAYVIFFVISILICKGLSKFRWIRARIFGEKIVEGKWFECIYLDSEFTQEFSYGVVDTFFDDNGEFVYKGTDYSLDGFAETGAFRSTCSSLKYDNMGDRATLDYAYEFEHNNQRDQGYGCINFTVGSYGSNRHHGKFFNSDGNTYYFSAILITDKTIIKALSSGSQIEFFNAMTKLVNAYKEDRVSQTERINAVYELSPETFDSFCRKEDYERNLKSLILKNNFKDKVVLDMGAGTGRLSELVVSDARHLICTDSSKRMLKFLTKSQFAEEYGDKIEFIHCDHMALPIFLKPWLKKVDYILAGYTIGAYFNDEFISASQKDSLTQSIVSIAESILSDGGTFIIVESLGIKDSNGRVSLLQHDKDLVDYYNALERLGFERTEIDTTFKFDTEEEANKTIYSFWGVEGRKKLTKSKNAWILNEVSCVWQKTFYSKDAKNE